MLTSWMTPLAKRRINLVWRPSRFLRYCAPHYASQQRPSIPSHNRSSLIYIQQLSKTVKRRRLNEGRCGNESASTSISSDAIPKLIVKRRNDAAWHTALCTRALDLFVVLHINSSANEEQLNSRFAAERLPKPVKENEQGKPEISSESE